MRGPPIVYSVVRHPRQRERELCEPIVRLVERASRKYPTGLRPCRRRSGGVMSCCSAWVKQSRRHHEMHHSGRSAVGRGEVGLLRAVSGSIPNDHLKCSRSRARRGDNREGWPPLNLRPLLFSPFQNHSIAKTRLLNGMRFRVGWCRRPGRPFTCSAVTGEWPSFARTTPLSTCLRFP
jgi:hypothetical protein